MEFKRIDFAAGGDLSRKGMCETSTSGAGFDTDCAGSDVQFCEDESGIGGIKYLCSMREGERP